MGLPSELQSALLGRRVVFLRGHLDDAAANSVIAQLLLISRTASGQPSEWYVDSPGGALAAALSVYDVVQTLATRVSTTCIGTVGGASVLVLAGGQSGLRFALPHARIQLMQAAIEIPVGRPTQARAQADEAVRLQQRWQAALAEARRRAGLQLAPDLSATGEAA